jgi:Mlc titration factor MtfA (ptsG expression regulator)
MFGFFKRRRRNHIRAAPFPTSWRAILSETFLTYTRLSEADRNELEQHILVFLDEKKFEGCDGFQITDAVRVTIAAQACLLLLHRSTDYYPRLHTILVYPDTYVAKTRRREEDEDTDRHSRTRVGESWVGTVVLTWFPALEGVSGFKDGQNLVLHEFAHQLDQEDGLADGAPVLKAGGLFETRDRYRTWARVLSAEYEKLRAAARNGEKTVLDKYGAKNPAEFFAVATECFFERPRQLKQKRPELYDELKRYYEQDPISFAADPENA